MAGGDSIVEYRAARSVQTESATCSNAPLPMADGMSPREHANRPVPSRPRHIPCDPPALLTMPTYGGTLTAVRDLGERGIPVTVVGEELLAPARWSRYTSRWLPCPPATQSEAFLEWLLEFGRREPGHVLYPTSDDLAYLIAANAAELEPYFQLYQPPVETIVRVLDKKTLWAACNAAGVATVPTWFPANTAEALELGREAAFPLLIKPRTQVLRARQTKGKVVCSRDALREGYSAFISEDHYLPGIERHFGDVTNPMLQQFCPPASEGVYSVTGFIDRTGQLFTARAARKVLQRTRPVGLGVCFEAAPLDPRLAESVRRLCQSVGYFGVFEVEFLREGDRWMAIDFNPRFYGQLGFDVRRGLPLPFLAWLGASGQVLRLREVVAGSAQAPDGPATIYCHRVIFELMVLVQAVTGRMSAAERKRWRTWFAEHRAGAVDASADARDWLPGVVHTAAEVWAGLRALPRTLRQA